MSNYQKQGQILVQALVLSALAVVFITVLVNLAIFNINTASRSFHSEQAFQIAEAGIEYYRWHLSHAPTDYQNGTGAPGPYTIEYKDKDGVRIGEFTLDITAPPVGSTVVTIRSTGKLDADQLVKRVIETKLAIPSLAKYSIVANDKIRFGTGTTVFGPLHSNDGIRFDGTANNLVTSAKSDYDDPDHGANPNPPYNNNEFGVHTHRDPPPATSINNTFRPLEAPPNPVQNRTDVFLAGREFPVPAVDFAGLTADLAQIKADAQSDGRYFASSGSFGYEIVLKTNDTFDIYKVNSLKPAPSNCRSSATGWGTWSINSTANATTTVALNNPIPANGLIFVEDHVWVSGTVNGARVTIASGRFPENPTTNTSITVNNDLLYTNYNGEDIVALIAQNNFNVGLFSEDNIRIDAALVAKNGRAGRYYYLAPVGSTQYCGS